MVCFLFYKLTYCLIFKVLCALFVCPFLEDKYYYTNFFF
ncbi:hypothetical protein BN177_160005 [Clostridioides difficile E24]|nr:hypothetical protein BN177_160005 [Clostridioides difficile E24]